MNFRSQRYDVCMMSELGLRISNCVERIIPDPFVIAIVLTVATAISALIWGDFGNSNSLGIGKDVETWVSKICRFTQFSGLSRKAWNISFLFRKIGH